MSQSGGPKGDIITIYNTVSGWDPQKEKGH